MAIRWMPLTLAATLIAGVAALAPTVYARSIETPAYVVESKQEGFEVRRYEGRLVAEVEVEGEPNAASNAGFRILANFIFGANEAHSEVAMTAPVDRRPAEAIEMTAPVDRRASDGEGERWVITFTMPSKYTKDTLPTPTDARITIRELPATSYAVVRFSGAPTEKTVQRRIRELEAAVGEAGYETRGEAVYARYDPPWTLGFLRRNEILIEIVVE
jgi:hypothetical protein